MPFSPFLNFHYSTVCPYFLTLILFKCVCFMVQFNRLYMKGQIANMTIYISLAILLVVLGVGFEALNMYTKDNFNKPLPNYTYIIPSFVAVFFVSAFRGDFMTDYVNYRNRFNSLLSIDFFDLFKYEHNIEFGYVLLNGFIQLFTDNSLYLFVITTIIILVCFYHQFSKYSTKIWLSLLMFITVGSYYASFNITRQIMVAAILFAGSKFLYERKLFKYILVVIVAFMFHKSALIMIPFYFILNFRINFRNLFLFFATSTILVFFFDGFLDIVQNFVYDNYTEDSYGMTGQSVANVVLPVSFLIFSLFNIKKLDTNNSMHRIWINAVFFYALFNVLALQVEMVERIGRYFAPYALLLIPYLFSKMKNKHLRFIYMMVLIFMLVLYNFVILNNSTFDPYYFIWDR